MNPHPSVYIKLAGMSDVMKRRYLKSLWFSKGEQNEMIRRTHEMYEKKQSAF